MRKYILLFLLTFPFLTFSQIIDFNYYKTLKSRGSLPEDVTTLSSVKYKKEKEEFLKKEESRKVKKAKDNFLLESNFKIDEMLLGGRVLYNDTISNYVRLVAKEILKNDISTFNKLRFYVIKSAVVNAYTTNSGIIFINIGLISQLENEAQLAFILCHEIIHFKKSHMLEEVEENVKIQQRTKKYRVIENEDDAILAKLRFSKDKEKEADNLGLKLFLESKYSTSALSGAFDVLEFSYLPFDEVKFDFNLFQSETFQFPVNYMLPDSSVNPISGADEDDDTYSTHPNVQQRRDGILENINEEDNNGKVLYVFPEQQFKFIRKVCRFETFRSFLIGKYYQKAIYTGFLILKEEEPNSLYIRRGISKALTDLFVYSINSDNDYKDDYFPNYKKIEGSSQQLYFLLEKVYKKPIEMGVLALRYTSQQLQKNPKDPYLINCQNTIIRVFVEKKKIKPSSYLFKIQKPDTLTISKTVVLTDSISSKYDKIKKKKEEKNLNDKKTKSHITIILHLLIWL